MLYRFVHFQGLGLRKSMNICYFLDDWPPNSKSRAILRDLPYLRLGSCCQRDFGVNFHIVEVKDHNDDKPNTAKLTGDLQIQGHAYIKWPSIYQAGLVLAERS